MTFAVHPLLQPQNQINKRTLTRNSDLVGCLQWIRRCCWHHCNLHWYISVLPGRDHYQYRVVKMGECRRMEGKYHHLSNVRSANLDQPADTNRYPLLNSKSPLNNFFLVVGISHLPAWVIGPETGRQERGEPHLHFRPRPGAVRGYGGNNAIW